MTELIFYTLSALFFSSFIYYSLKEVAHQNLFLLALSYSIVIWLSKDHGVFLITSTIISFLSIRYFLDKRVHYLCVLFLFSLLIFVKITTQSSPIAHLIPGESALIPLGISFFIFQLSGAVLDYSRQPKLAKPTLLDFSLFCAYIPQFAAGPIESSKALLPQIAKLRLFQYDKVKEGLLMCFGGLVKKVFFANALFAYLAFFKDSNSTSFLDILVLALFTRYYIFFSFSAYVDMARGSSQFFGINLSKNFQRPLNSSTLTEFWNKWHITLGTWVKNYLFFPLAIKAQRKKISIVPPTIISFVFIGLWHEISLSFLLYGLIQGIVISLEHVLGLANVVWSGPKKILNYLYRYFVIFIPSLLFFFTPNDLYQMVLNTHTDIKTDHFIIQFQLILLILLFELFQTVDEKCKLLQRITTHQKSWLRWTFYFIAISCVFLFGSFEEDAMFLYFNI